MAQVDNASTFGAELRYGFKSIDKWVASGITWLEDIEQFYRERSVLEKEYGNKLNLLAKKYIDKKGKKSSLLSVGESPKLTPGSLECASLTTWTTQLSALEHYAAERERLSADLITVIADPLERLRIRHEDIRKRHVLYAENLKRQQETTVQELQKHKTTYDVACQNVENRRKKMDASIDSSRQKSHGAFQQQLMEMHNAKNTYLIGINVANQQKHKHRQEYLPDLLNRLQDLNEIRVMKLNRLWSLAAQLEKSSLLRSVESLDHALSEIPRNDPSLDSIMFIRHNVGQSEEPQDIAFEPSPVWHDDASMVVGEQAKNYLRNLLGKSKSQLLDQNRVLVQKRQELDKLKQIHASVRAGTDKRDEVEVVAAVLAVQESYQHADKDRLAAEVAVATIKAVAGDLTLGVRNHKLRPETFRIPTNCDLCGERIWGLTAKGYDCSDCGYTCHNKCEMKVPASCPGELSKEEKRKLKAEREKASHATPSIDPSPTTAELPAISRSNTMNSLSSGYATSARRSVSTTLGGSTASTASSERTLVEETPNGNDTTPTPAPKSQSSSTRRNRIVAPPPTQYVSELPASEVAPTKSAPASASEAVGRMIYAYQRNGADELTVDEGVSINILEPDDGSGWIKVRAGVKEGIVPASYVELVPASIASLSPRPDSTYSNSSASLASSTTKKKGPVVAPKKGAKKLHHVAALYDYEARSDAEWSMRAGERFVLVTRDAGDGWSDVERGGVVKSVPANYIQDAS